MDNYQEVTMVFVVLLEAGWIVFIPGHIVSGGRMEQIGWGQATYLWLGAIVSCNLIQFLM